MFENVLSSKFDELRKANERMYEHVNKLVLENGNLAMKNRELQAENRALLQRLKSSEGQSAAKRPRMEQSQDGHRGDEGM